MARAGLGPNWTCAFANDIDREKAASYADNFGREGLVVRDVARLTTADLPGRADLAWASFPCHAALDIPDEIVAPGPETPFHPPMLVKACSHQTAPIWWRLPAPPSRNLALVDIVEDTPTGVHWNSGAATARLIGMMAPLHLAKLDLAKRAVKRMVGAIFRRMRDEAGGRVQRAEIRFDIAGCLRVPAGGSSRQTVMIVEGDTVRSRLMSPRECARLMGLDDGYQWPADLNEALALMGDGVAVSAVRHLAEHLLEPLLRAVEADATATPIAKDPGLLDHEGGMK
jgi:site-specific DNA-cytosine methylase